MLCGANWLEPQNTAPLTFWKSPSFVVMFLNRINDIYNIELLWFIDVTDVSNSLRGILRANNVCTRSGLSLFLATFGESLRRFFMGPVGCWLWMAGYSSSMKYVGVSSNSSGSQTDYIGTRRVKRLIPLRYNCTSFYETFPQRLNNWNLFCIAFPCYLLRKVVSGSGIRLTQEFDDRSQAGCQGYTKPRLG